MSNKSTQTTAISAFLVAFCIVIMDKYSNFTLGTEVKHNESHRSSDKQPLKGEWYGSHDQCWKLGVRMTSL